MKKAYEAPEILFENFSLSTSISVGCELDTPLPSYEQNCGYPVKGGIVFSDPNQCTHPEQSGTYNGFCYHVPVEEKNLFNS